MRQRTPLPRLAPMTALLLAAGVTVGTVQAATVEDVPALTDWNLDNTYTVNPDSVEDGKTFIYPDVLTRQTDEGNAQDGTGSIGFVSWELDVGGGEPPGIQVISDDDGFRVNNCIMASGKATDEDTGEVLDVDKKCSDFRSSSKRYKLTVTQADAGVDLIFDTTTRNLFYEEGIDVDTVEVGRIYRVIQKMINDTDERIQSLKVELGFGAGDQFEPVSVARDNIGFELRTEVDSAFFGELSGELDPDHGGDLQCTTCHQAEDPNDYPSAPQVEADHGGDQACTTCHTTERLREVWDENRFATFSPAMFNEGAVNRFEDGFFDVEPAGLFPPQDLEDGDRTQFIDSGTEVDTTGIVGATTINYFSRFGYMLPDSMLPTGIFIDDDGDASTEGELIAWWDGDDWRYGRDENFAVVADSELETWAERPLSEEEVLDPPRYETALIDDLSALNMDTYIYLGEGFDVSAHDSVTLRVTANSVTANTIDGSEDPLWTQEGNAAPSLASYLEDGSDDDDSGSNGDDDDTTDDDTTDDETSDSSGGGGGCTVASNSAFDPMLPGMALLALGYLGLRRRWDASV